MSLSEPAVILHRLQQDREKLQARLAAVQRREANACEQLTAVAHDEQRFEQVVADLKLRVATAKLVLDAIDAKAGEAALVTSELRADTGHLRRVAAQRAAVASKLDGAARQQLARAHQLARREKPAEPLPKAVAPEDVAALEEDVSRMRERQATVSRLLHDTLHPTT